MLLIKIGYVQYKGGYRLGTVRFHYFLSKTRAIEHIYTCRYIREHSLPLALNLNQPSAQSVLCRTQLYPPISAFLHALVIMFNDAHFPPILAVGVSHLELFVMKLF